MCRLGQSHQPTVRYFSTGTLNHAYPPGHETHGWECPGYCICWNVLVSSCEFAAACLRDAAEVSGGFGPTLGGVPSRALQSKQDCFRKKKTLSGFPLRFMGSGSHALKVLCTLGIRRRLHHIASIVITAQPSVAPLLKCDIKMSENLP
jgi:hypothetical protein